MRSVFLSFVFLSCMAMHGQSLDRQVIGSAGTSSSAGNIELSWTVGEPVVATGTSGNLVVTQGFQQPDDTGTQVSIPQITHNIAFTVFPVPAGDVLKFTWSSTDDEAFAITLYSVSGAIIQSPIQQNGFEGSGEIDLAGVAAGQYVLSVIRTTDNASLGAYTIEKIR